MAVPFFDEDLGDGLTGSKGLWEGAGVSTLFVPMAVTRTSDSDTFDAVVKPCWDKVEGGGIVYFVMINHA